MILFGTEQAEVETVVNETTNEQFSISKFGMFAKQRMIKVKRAQKKKKKEKEKTVKKVEDCIAAFF